MSRILLNGQRCSNERKIFFHYSCRASYTFSRDYLPLWNSRLYSWNFANLITLESSICHVYLVAYYHRIRLLHPSSCDFFLFVSVPASLLIERDGTTAAPDSLPRVIIAAGSGLLSHGSWTSYALRYASDGSSSRAKIARYTSRSGRWIGDLDWIIWILNFSAKQYSLMNKIKILSCCN